MPRPGSKYEGGRGVAQHIPWPSHHQVKFPFQTKTYKKVHYKKNKVMPCANP